MLGEFRGVTRHVADYPVNKNFFFFLPSGRLLKNLIPSLRSPSADVSYPSVTPATGSPGTRGVSLKLHRGVQPGYNRLHTRADREIVSEAKKIPKSAAFIRRFLRTARQEARFASAASPTTHFQQPRWLHFTQIQPDVSCQQELFLVTVWIHPAEFRLRSR